MRGSQLAMVGAGLALVLAACSTPDVTVAPVVGESGPAPGISVVGEGEVEGAPDTLSIWFGVSVLRPSVDEAVADAAEQADGLIEALEAQGVAKEDIQTANYSIYPEYDYRETGQVLKGYRVENTVSAKIRDLESAGSVIDAAAAAVGDEVRVSNVSFAIEDDEQLLEAARAAAWADASAKAGQLAGLAGVQLGEAISISESLEAGPPIVIPFAREEAAAIADTPIQPGQQTVTIRLQVHFAISD